VEFQLRKALRPRESLARMFSSLHMRYAQYFQKKNKASGHVWQGRFYSCLLSGDHRQAAIRYVERNPVRAHMVYQAWEYPWSSARAHTGKRYRWITLADVRELVSAENWKAYLMEGDEGDFLKNIRKATGKNFVLGTGKFILKLERILGRRIRPNPMGRPRRMNRAIEGGK